MGVKSFLHKSGEFISDTKNSGIKRAAIKRIGRERRNYYMNTGEAYDKFLDQSSKARDYLKNRQDLPKINDGMRQVAKDYLAKRGMNFYENPNESSKQVTNRIKNSKDLLFGVNKDIRTGYVNVANGNASTLAHELGHVKNGILNRLRSYVNGKFGKSIYDNTDAVAKESSKIGMLKRYLAEKLDTIEEKAATKKGLRGFLSNYYNPNSKEYKAAEDSLMKNGALGTYENTRKAHKRLMLGNLISIPTRKTYLGEYDLYEPGDNGRLKSKLWREFKFKDGNMVKLKTNADGEPLSSDGIHVIFKKGIRPLDRDEYGDWKFFSSNSEVLESIRNFSKY